MRNLVKFNHTYNLGNKKEIFKFFHNSKVKVKILENGNTHIEKNDRGFVLSMLKPTIFRTSFFMDMLFDKAKGYEVYKDEEGNVKEIIVIKNK